MENEYHLVVKLSVLRLLGPNLYSNIPAILSEMIANAWDADATKVDIRLNLKEDEIEIEDNGLGMPQSDLNDKYLSVGYEKRKEDSQRVTTLFKRHVMGRKGIGKLAMFSFAELAEIHSSHETGKAGCILKWKEIEDKFETSTYQPQAISPDEVSVQHKTGTRVILRQIQVEKLGPANDVAKLRMYLARRFTILDGMHNFEVCVNDIPISDADRGYFDAMQFVWYLGDEFKQKTLCPHLAITPIAMPYQFALGDKDGTKVSVKGWVGTVKTPSVITDDQNNVVSLYANGKMVHENVITNEIKARTFATYLIGDIEADFLDDDEQNDIVIANRQEVRADDPRFIALRDFIVSKILSKIGDSWTKMRNIAQIDPRLMSDDIEDWYVNLKSKRDQEKASSILKRLSVINLDVVEEIRFAKIIINSFEEIKKIKGLVAQDDGGFLSVIKSYDPSDNNDTSSTSDEPASTQPDQDSTSSKDSDSTGPSDSQEPTEQTPSTEQTGSTQSGDQGTNSSSNETSPSPTPNDDDADFHPAFDFSEPFERLGPVFRRITPPEREANRIFGEIKRTLEQSRMPEDLKNMAIHDVRDSCLAYFAGANKASIVMLGAAIEGVMISVVHNNDVLMDVRTNRPMEIPLLEQCGIANANVPISNVIRNFSNANRKYGFEEYRAIIVKLLGDIPDVDKLREIQTFRNIIHPLVNISYPAYQNIDATRALNLLSSMEIICKIILSLLVK
jgi:hypothetical protein